MRLFTASIVLFSIASLLCGLSRSLQELIVFRVLQGAVAGPMIPLSQALLLSSFSKAKAGTALAIWAMTTLVAPVMGPLLGGWITDNISWPWIFYINIPVGVFAAAATWGIYASRETARRKLPIDGVGLALLMVWVGSLQIMLDKGQELDWFHSSTVVALAVIAVVLALRQPGEFYRAYLLGFMCWLGVALGSMAINWSSSDSVFCTGIRPS